MDQARNPKDKTPAPRKEGGLRDGEIKNFTDTAAEPPRPAREGGMVGEGDGMQRRREGGMTGEGG